MAAPAVESADAMDSQRALSDQEYSMTHVYQPPLPFVRQDGQEYEANKAHKASPQHEQQSARLSRLHTSVADILSASSYNLVTSARQNESDNVVMPMTDSGEVDRLAVLCHCAYASQFSENPEDIFKFACMDAKVNQCEDPPRGSCTPETQGPFPQAIPVCVWAAWVDRLCCHIEHMICRSHSSSIFHPVPYGVASVHLRLSTCARSFIKNRLLPCPGTATKDQLVVTTCVHNFV